MDRKQYALELFRQRLSSAALFSVGRFEIRRFSQMDLPVPLDLLQIAQSVSPPQRHYFVWFQNQHVSHNLVQLHRFGTLSEVRALAQRLCHHPEIRSLLVISNASHLRRIRLCCRTLIDSQLAITYAAAPVRSSNSAAPLNTPLGPLADQLDQNTLRPATLLLELLKLLVYWFVLKLRGRF
jgi:hypothetical protein